jgi:hypothetical protein
MNEGIMAGDSSRTTIPQRNTTFRHGESIIRIDMELWLCLPGQWTFIIRPMLVEGAMITFSSVIILNITRKMM